MGDEFGLEDALIILQRRFLFFLLPVLLSALDYQYGIQSVTVGIGNGEVLQCSRHGLPVGGHKQILLPLQAKRDQTHQYNQGQNRGNHAQYPETGRVVAAAVHIEPLLQPAPGAGWGSLVQAVLIISEKIEYISFTCHGLC